MNKVSVTIRIDEDIVEAFKKLAEQTPGGKYQALMNSALREYVDKKSHTDIESRISRLETIILKKK